MSVAGATCVGKRGFCLPFIRPGVADLYSVDGIRFYIVICWASPSPPFPLSAGGAVLMVNRKQMGNCVVDCELFLL